MKTEDQKVRKNQSKRPNLQTSLLLWASLKTEFNDSFKTFIKTIIFFIPSLSLSNFLFFFFLSFFLFFFSSHEHPIRRYSPNTTPFLSFSCLFLCIYLSLLLLQLDKMMFLRRKQSQNHPIDEAADKEAKVKELRDALGPLSGRSLKYCSDSCLRRYLEARNWNVDKAKKMLEESLKWRASYKPEEIRWSEVAHEGETGKVSKANFHDRLGRPVLIMRPGLQNTNSPEGNIRHLVYLIENGILNLPEGQEQMSWLIDFTGFTLNTNVSVKTAREIINILQNHYPERLAGVFLYNPPRFFQAFWKAVRYFLDPKTFQKVKFIYPKNKDSVDLMKTFFNIDNLPSELGGKATLKYDHEEFSRLMAQDDVKTAKFWGFDDTPSNRTNSHFGAEVVAPVPLFLAPPDS